MKKIVNKSLRVLCAIIGFTAGLCIIGEPMDGLTWGFIAGKIAAFVVVYLCWKVYTLLLSPQELEELNEERP